MLASSSLYLFNNSTLVKCGVMLYILFPGPLAFCKKAVERVNSEKNILNISVECVEWSGVVFFRKSHMYVHH